jgi:hypothetical protein
MPPGQVDLERRAAPGLTVDPDVAAALLHDPVDRRQPQPDPLALPLGGKEGLEDPGPGVRVHPDADVGCARAISGSRLRFRTSFNHQQMQHPSVLADDLDTATEMLLQGSDQGASARSIPGAGTAQVALELATGDEVRERLLGEHGREPVGHPFRGQERSHERAWRDEIGEAQIT